MHSFAVGCGISGEATEVTAGVPAALRKFVELEAAMSGRDQFCVERSAEGTCSGGAAPRWELAVPVCWAAQNVEQSSSMAWHGRRSKRVLGRSLSIIRYQTSSFLQWHVCIALSCCGGLAPSRLEGKPAAAGGGNNLWHRVFRICSSLWGAFWGSRQSRHISSHKPF